MNNPEKVPFNRNHMCINAIARFDAQLTNRDEPLTNFDMNILARELIGASLDYTMNDVDGFMDYFNRVESIPQNYDIFDDEQKSIEWLKVSLFCELKDLYAMNHSKEDFNEWIEPYLRSALSGHYDESGNHAKWCISDKCISEIIVAIVTEDVAERRPFIDGNDAYALFSEEMTNMNVSIVRTLGKLGVIDPLQVTDLLDDYEEWLQSFDEPVFYDRNLFHHVRPRNKKKQKPIASEEK